MPTMFRGKLLGLATTPAGSLIRAENLNLLDHRVIVRVPIAGAWRAKVLAQLVELLPATSVGKPHSQKRLSFLTKRQISVRQPHGQKNPWHDRSAKAVTDTISKHAHLRPWNLRMLDHRNDRELFWVNSIGGVTWVPQDIGQIHPFTIVDAI